MEDRTIVSRFVQSNLTLPNNRLSIFKDATRKSSLKVIKKGIYAYLTSIFGGEDFESPEFNLVKVRDTLNGESIFRRVVDKYQEQIWNNGWSFVGRNRENVKYINKRFNEIEYVTGIPTSELFERITRQLVQFSNAFIIKKRSSKSSSGRQRTHAGKKLQPVAGYYPQPAEYMQIKRDQQGRIEKYRLAVNPSTFSTSYFDTTVEWDPEDVIHISIYQQEGYSFGTPMIAPVISDIASLRQMENSTNIMVFQHTIPILHFAVGSENEPGELEEIEDLNNKIEAMATYGHLVTGERVKIDIIGAGRQIIDTIPILEYWKTRVYAGLGISSVGLGETDTSNRGTATTVISEFHNTATHFQRKISSAIENHMIKELLAEKGIHPLSLTDKQMVRLHLPEIDVDTKIKKETHTVYLYEHNAISEDEMRLDLGMEPIHQGQREDMYLERYTIPKALASKGIVGDEEVFGTSETNNKNQPSNQYGVKTAPTLPKND